MTTTFHMDSVRIHYIYINMGIHFVCLAASALTKKLFDSKLYWKYRGNVYIKIAKIILIVEQRWPPS